MSLAVSPWVVLLAVIAGCAALAVTWWRHQSRDARQRAEAQAALDLDLGALQPPTEWQTLGPRTERAVWPDTVPAARPAALAETADALPGEAWAKPGTAAPAATPRRRRRSSAMPPFAPTGSPGL